MVLKSPGRQEHSTKTNLTKRGRKKGVCMKVKEGI